MEIIENEENVIMKDESELGSSSYYTDLDNTLNNTTFKLVNTLKFPKNLIKYNKIPECLVIAFEKLEKTIAAGYTDGTILVYDTLGGLKKKLILEDNIQEQNNNSPITSVRWKPHDQNTPKNVLLSVNTDGQIIHWHSTSGKILHKIEEKNVACLSLDYNADGSKFVVGADDKILRIYDENIKVIDKKFSPGGSYSAGHTSRINAVCFHKNDTTGNFSNFLATGGWDQQVLFYDTRANKITGKILGPYVCGHSIDLKDYNLVTGSYSSKVGLQIWDIRVHKLIEDIKLNSYDAYSDINIYCTQFSKNTKTNLLAFGSSKFNEFKVLNIDDEYSTYIESKILEKACYTLDFSYGGNYVAFSGADANIRIVKL